MSEQITEGLVVKPTGAGDFTLRDTNAFTKKIEGEALVARNEVKPLIEWLRKTYPQHFEQPEPPTNKQRQPETQVCDGRTGCCAPPAQDVAEMKLDIVSDIVKLAEKHGLRLTALHAEALGSDFSHVKATLDNPAGGC